MPAVVAAFVEMVPALIKWIGVALDQGRNPKAELDAMLDSAEVAAIVAEKVKFG